MFIQSSFVLDSWANERFCLFLSYLGAGDKFINQFLPTILTFAVRETDVSRYNGGTSGAPLKPLRDDSALRALSTLRSTIDSEEHYRLIPSEIQAVQERQDRPSRYMSSPYMWLQKELFCVPRRHLVRLRWIKLDDYSLLSINNNCYRQLFFLQLWFISSNKLTNAYIQNLLQLWPILAINIAPTPYFWTHVFECSIYMTLKNFWSEWYEVFIFLTRTWTNSTWPKKRE